MGGKLRAALSLAIMFGLGIVGGMVLQIYRAQHLTPHPVYAAHRIKRLKNELALTAKQEAELRDIFAQAHERAKQINEEVSWDLNDIHKDSVKAIRQVLTPEQNQKFERIHRQYHTTTQSPDLDDEFQSPPSDSSSGMNS